MRRLHALLACALLLAGCAGGPPPPDWQLFTHAALHQAMSAELDGRSALAELEYTRARREVSATGQPEALARVELVRCATRLASLVLDGCAAYLPLAADAAAPERAYAAYLQGRWSGLDRALLPPQHRAVPGTEAAGAARVLGEIGDPLARLVAAGVLLQQGRLSPEAVQVASDTASAQGWRQPLLAWLGVQARLAEQAGQREALARLQRRMAVVRDGGTPPAAAPSTAPATPPSRP